MTMLGPNLRCVAGHGRRDEIARFYVELFGAEASTPTPELDVYRLEGDCHIGVYFVPDEQALSPEQHEAVGTWIELVVDDVDATQRRLEERGHAPLAYHDQAHSYFQAPGGQVFRLARRGS